MNVGSASRTYTRKLRACIVTLLGCNAPGAATVPAMVADVSRTFNPPAQTVNLRTPGEPGRLSLQGKLALAPRLPAWKRLHAHSTHVAHTEYITRAQLRRAPPRSHK